MEDKKQSNPRMQLLDGVYASDAYKEKDFVTLRDHFAGLAIQTPVTYKPSNLWQWLKWAFNYPYKANSRPHHENASQAYDLADAMLKQREL